MPRGPMISRSALIVDDERDIRELISDILKDEGFDINVFDRNTPLTDIVDKALQK